MKILLCNDDGILADGLGVLASVLSERHEVFVAAPDRQRSAVSRAMLLTEPVTARRGKLPLAPGVEAYQVSGYPVDCLRLALGNLYGWPDMVISGINHGPNLGTDCLYSGTVAAAHEAAMLGIPAIAVSTASYAPGAHFETAARLACRAAERLVKKPLPRGTVLNLNVPDLPMEEISGIRSAPLAPIAYALPFHEQEGGADGIRTFMPPAGEITSDNSGMDVDETWVHRGYAVFTEITWDMTDYENLGSFPVEGLLEDGTGE